MGFFSLLCRLIGAITLLGVIPAIVMTVDGPILILMIVGGLAFLTLGFALRPEKPKTVAADGVSPNISRGIMSPNYPAYSGRSSSTGSSRSTSTSTSTSRRNDDTSYFDTSPFAYTSYSSYSSSSDDSCSSSYDSGSSSSYDSSSSSSDSSSCGGGD